MRYVSFIFIFLFLVTSCQDIKRIKKPEDLIPEDKMVDVLIEMSLLQGARSYRRQDLENRGFNPDEYLWEKFDIDSSRFARSNRYYSENYVIYQRIYEKVKDSLESLKVEFDSIREHQEREKDSLRAIEREREDTLKEEEPQRRQLDSVVPVPDTSGVLPKAPRQRRIRRDSF